MNTALTAVQAYAAAVFFLLWIALGWSDFKHQKIRNRSLRYGAWAAAA